MQRRPGGAAGRRSRGRAPTRRRLVGAGVRIGTLTAAYENPDAAAARCHVSSSEQRELPGLAAPAARTGRCAACRRRSLKPSRAVAISKRRPIIHAKGPTPGLPLAPARHRSPCRRGSPAAARRRGRSLSGIMLDQPVAHQVLQLVRQAQQHVAGLARAGCVARLQDGLDLVVVDRRDDRRDEHAHRDARPRRAGGSCRGASPGVAARGSIRRASFGSSVVTEIATLASCRSAIRARMSMSRVTRADFVTMPTGWFARSSTSRIAAGDAEAPLDRLVGIGVGAERDGLRLVARRAQLLLEELGARSAWRRSWSRNRGPATGPGRRGSAARSSRRSRARSPDRG